MEKILTLEILKQSPIVNTDVGELIAIDGIPEQEFLVKGKIERTRAGLFFIDIEGEKFTFPKNSNFKEGEEVICVLRAEVNSLDVNFEGNNAHFIVKGLEHL
jgi:hypothetical protein